MGAILNSGKGKFAQHQGLEQPLVINRFVFALIDGLDTGADVDLNESMPTPAEIVHEEPVNGKGYLSPDKVVYSVILGPAVGDFYFNWIGLVSSDNTLMAVSYTPTQYKYKTVGLNIGNTLTRNFLLQYTDAQALTGIDIPVEAWQVDFMGRFESIEDHQRRDMQTVYGESYFINDGFRVTTNGANLTVTAGYGYVGGLRATLLADQVIDIGVPPKDIYLDVMREGDVSGSQVIAAIVSSPVNVPLSAYEDANGRPHFVVKIATINAALAVTDTRKNIVIEHALIDALLNRLNHTGQQAISTVEGLQQALNNLQAGLENTAPANHVHTWNQIEDKPVTFPAAAHSHGWNEIQNKPASFPPAEHNHSWNDIQNKPDTFPPSGHSHSANDLPSASLTQRGITQLTSSLTSTSTSMAATPAAVKSVNDALTNFSESLFSTATRKTLTVTKSSQVNSGWFHYWVVGKFAFFEIYLWANWVGGTSPTPSIVVIPPGERPQSDTTVTLYVGPDLSGGILFVSLKITTSGQVFLEGDAIQSQGGISEAFCGIWRIF